VDEVAAAVIGRARLSGADDGSTAVQERGGGADDVPDVFGGMCGRLRQFPTEIDASPLSSTARIDTT